MHELLIEDRGCLVSGAAIGELEEDPNPARTMGLKHGRTKLVAALGSHRGNPGGEVAQSI